MFNKARGVSTQDFDKRKKSDPTPGESTHKKLLQQASTYAFDKATTGLRAQVCIWLITKREIYHHCQFMFVSEEMERLHRALKETEQKQEMLQAQIRDHCLRLTNNFETEDLKTLEKMEEQEVVLAQSFMITCVAIAHIGGL